ncbi:DNA end-binding protein Ku [Labedaea rhizosphaerae]|uniref:Non-homologous end joining protein Ku n=2 Tax=Labedaea rhizosphaerae TaxID=598644 RepID=A0A4R6RYG6_LABRH|nr:DNA end-binding protein Ku [Labedaea rhizosphaerae]
MWRGAISFGLVTIGVRLYTATEEHDVAFHQVHREDGGRIKYKRVCSVCGEEVAYQDIAKGRELEDGRMVILDKEDFEHLPVKTDHAIEVMEFVAAEDVDPIFFQKSYYLEPDKSAVRPYVLLRTVLENEERLALVKITIRQRETLAILRAREDILVLHTMMWPDEIRKPDFGFLDEDVEVRQQELKMAGSLVESMAGDFEPDQYTDDYTVALEKMVEAKAEGAELPEVEEEAEEGDVIDLMTALERSVEAAKKGRSSSGSTKKSSSSGTKKTASKSTTRKTPAKKSSKTA